MFSKLIFLVSTVLLVHSGVEASCNQSAIRIYGGSSPNRGMLQICRSGKWYAVCAYIWDCDNARVACRQLGYTGVVAYYPYCCNRFGSWSNGTHNRIYHCTGTEMNLASCRYTTSTRCSTSYSYSRSYRTNGLYCSSLLPVASDCTNGDVRLMSGTAQNEGRVEICHHGMWSSVCSIDLISASVICHQLGYTRYASILTSRYGSNQALVSSLSCSYSYNHVNECTIIEYKYCTTSSSLRTCSQAIRCYPQPTEFCPERAVRLADGDIAQEGRVEVCVGGIWGTICTNGWSSGDAYVVCKQMGYDSGIAPANLYSQFGNGYGPKVYSSVSCHGFEKSLSQCRKNQYPQFRCYRYARNPFRCVYYACNRYSTVAVRCYDGCNTGDVRLVGGPTDSEGTVEICQNRLWGLVYDVNWRNTEAQVVCRQLNFPTQNAIAIRNSYYGRPNKTVHYSHVTCTGAEDKLTQCAKTTLSITIGKTTYKSASVAGVSCLGPPAPTLPCIAPLATPATPSCMNGQIRLMGGQTTAEGRLEYCYNGQWSPFCTLRSQEATVACKELGYTQYSSAAVLTDGRFGSTSIYSLFQNITCSNSASETALRDCTLYEAGCLPSCPNIGIRCFAPGSCKEGAVRLVDGFIQQEGRVEVCSNGVWGSVCDQSWDKTDAHVICQQMGHPELEPIAFHNSYFGDGHGPIVYSNVTCGGWEQSITDCAKTGYLSFSCSRRQTAGVLCGEHCHDGEIRLVGGDSKYEGTVEICFGNLWGLIAESSWGDHDAEVVCRQLGYLTEGAVSYGNSHFGKPNKTIQASDVICFGDEQTITECTLTTYELETGKQLINSVDVAGVICMHTNTTMNTSILANRPSTVTVIGQGTQVALSVVISLIGAGLIIAIVIIIILVALRKKRDLNTHDRQLDDSRAIIQKENPLYDIGGDEELKTQ